MQAFERKIVRPKNSGGREAERELFSFEAVATRTLFCITVARVAYVNFRKRTIVARTVVLTFGYPTANTGVYAFHFVVHHRKILLLAYKTKKFVVLHNEYGQFSKRLLTFLKISCKIYLGKRKICGFPLI